MAHDVIIRVCLGPSFHGCLVSLTNPGVELPFGTWPVDAIAHSRILSGPIDAADVTADVPAMCLCDVQSANDAAVCLW